MAEIINIYVGRINKKSNNMANEIETIEDAGTYYIYSKSINILIKTINILIKSNE